MSSAGFYKWRAKFGGMDASMISEMKALAEENLRLKRMYAAALRWPVGRSRSARAATDMSASLATRMPRSRNGW